MLQEITIETPAIRANGRSVRRSKLSAHYDALFQRIQAANLDTSEGQAIGITSCAPRAGVSTVAFNIAVTAARADYGPVLFIDADITKPTGSNASGAAPS